MAMTKDEVSDLNSLINSLLQQELQLERAKVDAACARNKVGLDKLRSSC